MAVGEHAVFPNFIAIRTRIYQNIYTDYTSQLLIENKYHSNQTNPCDIEIFLQGLFTFASLLTAPK